MSNISKKTISEIDWSFDSYSQDYYSGRVDIHLLMTNPALRYASFVSFKYKATSSGGWVNATLANEQSEPDLNYIPLSPRKRRVTIGWDAATDLRIMKAHENVEIQFQFNDREDRSGEDTQIRTFVLSKVDFTVQDKPRIYSPLPNDPYFEFEFRAPKAIRPCRMHFILEVDVSPNFDSNALLQYSSAETQEGWTYGGYAFPESGIEGNVKQLVKHINAELANLSEDIIYYYRVTPIVNQFLPVISNPIEGQVLIGTSLTIEGTVDIYD